MPKREPNPLIRPLMLHFARLWQEKFNAPYSVTWQKNLSQISKLLQTYTVEQVESYMNFYLGGYHDEFAKKCGYSFGAFITLLPSIIAGAKDAKEKANRGVLGSTDYERLEEARRRLGGDE